MNIINMNILTSNQYHDAKSLIELCKTVDNSRGISFLEPEMNCLKEFPCFFLMYNGGTLVSMLSVFIPDDRVCEIYSNTLPEFRGKGYFTRLLELAMAKIKDFGIEKVYIVNDPLCLSGARALSSIGAKLENTDYLMRYNNDIVPNPKRILSIKYKKNGNIVMYRGYLKEKEIGECYVEHNRATASIYGFWIKEKHRGRGYGTELLLLLLEHLLDSDCKRILLHVNNANKAAHKMYFNHGFVHEEQIDYWIYK